MKRISTAARRARLATRHRLAPSARAASPVTATRDIVALHGTDPATVYLSLFTRCEAPTVRLVEESLYDDRTLVRMLGMRRTMFVVPTGTVPIVHSACTEEIAVRERKRLVQFLAEAGGIEDPETWLAEVLESTMDALERRGEALAGELGEDEPRLRRQLVFGAGTKNEVTQGVVTRILFLLAADGRVARGRPRGTWISTQHRWAPMSKWLPALEPVPVTQARTELVRQWLAAFGPGTVADLKWWTGWTLGATRAALATVDTEEVELDDGATGLVLAGDTGTTEGPSSWVALLPALDPTVMGYATREWFLGPHGPALFDRNGNAGPTVWCDGRVVGGWAQRRTGEVAVRLLEKVPAAARRAIDAEALRLSEWLGPTRVTPRFRTPLEKELTG